MNSYSTMGTVRTNQDSYYWLCRFFSVSVFLRGRPIGAGLSRRPRRVSSLLMNRSDPKGRPLKVAPRILPIIRSSSGSWSRRLHRSPR